MQKKCCNVNNCIWFHKRRERNSLRLHRKEQGVVVHISWLCFWLKAVENKYVASWLPKEPQLACVQCFQLFFNLIYKLKVNIEDISSTKGKYNLCYSHYFSHSQSHFCCWSNAARCMRLGFKLLNNILETNLHPKKLSVTSKPAWHRQYGRSFPEPTTLGVGFTTVK